MLLATRDRFNAAAAAAAGGAGYGGSVTSPEGYLLALWAHECQRVFADKLITLEDKAWVEGAVQELATQVGRPGRGWGGLGLWQAASPSAPLASSGPEPASWLIGSATHMPARPSPAPADLWPRAGRPDLGAAAVCGLPAGAAPGRGHGRGGGGAAQVGGAVAAGPGLAWLVRVSVLTPEGCFPAASTLSRRPASPPPRPARPVARSCYESVAGGVAEVRRRVEEFMRRFNEESRSLKMELVLFKGGWW